MPNVPQGPVPNKTTKSSILLGDRFINLSGIHRATGLPIAYLSRIINGKQETSVRNLLKIATAVGMGLEELIDAIEVRSQEITRNKNKVVGRYQTRIKEEDKANADRVRKGLPPLPVIPGTRLPEDEKTV